jgi:hypothetical protein
MSDLNLNPENLGLTDADKDLVFTKEALGGAQEFQSAIDNISMAQVEAIYHDGPEGWDDVAVLAIPGVSVIDPDHRIHLRRVDDVRRAAKGAGLFIAGSLQDDGYILSPSGSRHFIENGVCNLLSNTKQIDSLSGAVSTIERLVPCKGHRVYKKRDGKFVSTGEELDRCKHMWVPMFANGFYVTFSKSRYLETAKANTAIQVGDEDAREQAQAYFDAKGEERQERFEVRKAFAQAATHTRDVMGLPQDAPLPPVNNILEYRLPDGRTLGEAVIAFKGAPWVCEFSLTINGTEVTQTVKGFDREDAKKEFAYPFAVSRNQGTEIKLLGIREG